MINEILIYAQALDNQSNDDMWINNKLDNTASERTSEIFSELSRGEKIYDDESTITLNGNDFMIKLSSDNRDVDGRKSPILICGNRKMHNKENIKASFDDFIANTNRKYNNIELNIVLEKLYTYKINNNITFKIILGTGILLTAIVIYKLFFIKG